METTAQPTTELTLTRTLDAPRELVFEAWTNAQHMKQWWGPHRFTNPVCELDVRPGGAILIHMQGPDGSIYPMSGTFIEINKPERLVFIASALDNNGQVMFENTNTITFAAEGNKTVLTLHVTVDKISDWNKVAPMLAGMREGWSQSLERLDTLVNKI